LVRRPHHFDPLFQELTVRVTSVASLALITLSAGAAPFLPACGGGDSPAAQASSSGSGGGTVIATSSATTGAGVGGGGGAGGDGVDHGAPSDVYPAFKPTPPTIVSLGGPVLATPKVVPVFFSNDDPLITAGLADFTSKVGATEYWTATTAEYGVGPMASGAPVQLSEAAPALLDDADIQAWLSAKLNADDPAFPVPDENTIFLLTYPAGVTVTFQGGSSCVNFGAYHNSLKLDANHGNITVPYAMSPRCASFGGLSGIDMVTSGASHELVEAVTDPAPLDNPAFELIDDDHLFWLLAVGSETGDMGTGHGPSAYAVFPGLASKAQRCWSNKAALALHDPCVPYATGEAYFNAAVVLPDPKVLSLGGGTKYNSHVVKIPVGESRDVEIDLFSDAPTSGPWTVDLVDVASLGGPASLKFVADRPGGVNGEKIHVSITAVKKGSPQNLDLSLFYVRSTLGTQRHLWVGAVANK
jgi:hypothetical protein